MNNCPGIFFEKYNTNVTDRLVKTKEMNSVFKYRRANVLVINTYNMQSDTIY